MCISFIILLWARAVFSFGSFDEVKYAKSREGCVSETLVES